MQDGSSDFALRSSPVAQWIRARISLIFFVAGTVSVLATQRSAGYTWDEAFYYEPALDAARWVLEIFKGHTPFEPRLIDLFWHERAEHPSFHKLLAGFSLLALEDSFLGPIGAMRLPIAILFGATLVLIYRLARAAWGKPAAVIAALAYWAMPRVFGHAHFSSIETPLVFATLLTIYCFIRGLDSPRWALATGIALGLLLATKINGFLLIPPLIVWGHLFHRRRYVNNLFSMIVAGPIVFVALWPWLWPDPLARALDYLSFHAGHQKTALWFLGRKWGYGDVNAPWFYPSVMIGVTVPLTILALSSLGLVRTALRWRGGREKGEGSRDGIAVLYGLIGVTMWGVASAPSTPKYDGVRLFLLVFPFLALMTGAGAEFILERAGRRDASAGSLRLSSRAPWALAFIIAADGITASALSSPYLLSYFNPLVGGLSGAAAKGFEVTYWGEAVNEDVLKTINDLPRGSRLRVLALHEQCFLDLQRWGKLRGDIVIGGPPPYDFHLLLMRKGFFARPERALAEPSPLKPSEIQPVAQWGHRAMWDRKSPLPRVTFLTLYRTGESFERYWPGLDPEP